VEERMFRKAGKWFSSAVLAFALAACDESPVSLPEPTSIAAPSGEIRLTVGDAASLPSQVLDQNGQPIRGLQPSFTSDNPSVVSVDANGNIRAVSPGTATITAAYGTVTATTKVTVGRNERGFVSTLDVMVDSVVTDVRAGAQPVPIRAFTAGGQSVCPQVTVQSTDRSVAGIAQDGCRLLVNPTFPGRTRVTVTADGVSDSFTVVVSSTGAVLFVSERPAPSELFAGNTVTYSVRLMDEAGNPVANRTVNFDVSAGRLSASSVTTNASGVATVQYTLPTDLRVFGAFQTLSYRAQLPNGGVASGSESVSVSAAAPTSITFFRSENFGFTFTPVSGTSINAQTFRSVYLGARGEDQFGNPTNDFTFTVTAPAQRFCGDFRSSDSVEYTCFFSNSAGTATFTASALGVSRSIQVVFTP
ncbi:MAG: Ig-like domain-containing protein, partial [Gemmatimonadetes bacterium]|nr:Ig-like domain-containing protein [Gemmatimonadota bacterium]